MLLGNYSVPITSLPSPTLLLVGNSLYPAADGSLTLPDASLTLASGGGYGPGGDGITGTISDSSVLFGTASGNYHTTTIGNVRTGVHFGPTNSLIGTYGGGGGGDIPMNQAVNTTLTPSSVTTFTLASEAVLATDTLGSRVGFQFDATHCTAQTEVGIFVRYVGSGKQVLAASGMLVQPGNTGAFDITLPAPVYSIVVGCRCVGSVGTGAGVFDGLISGN